MIKKLIEKAHYLEETQMQENEEPEIAINEKTGKIEIRTYRPFFGMAYNSVEFCDVADVNMDELKAELDKANIAYCL